VKKARDYPASDEWIGRSFLGHFAPDLAREGVMRSQVLERLSELEAAALHLADLKATPLGPSR